MMINPPEAESDRSGIAEHRRRCISVQICESTKAERPWGYGDSKHNKRLEVNSRGTSECDTEGDSEHITGGV